MYSQCVLTLNLWNIVSLLELQSISIWLRELNVLHAMSHFILKSDLQNDYITIIIIIIVLLVS